MIRPDLDLDDAAVGRLRQYEELLMSWNRHISLTSIPDAAIFAKLIAPSAWLGLRLSAVDIGLVADFGTGPGIPGIPMAIVDRRNHYFLIDSNQKKTGFIKHVLRTIDLPHVALFEGRLESATFINPVDTVVSRAAGSMRDVLQLFSGGASGELGGYFFKGDDINSEFEDLSAHCPSAKKEVLAVPDWFGNLRVVKVSAPCL